MPLPLNNSKKHLLFFRKLTNCYNSHYGEHNIVMMPPMPLVWGHSSLLEADLNCLSKLLEESGSWKYYVNIAGSEYPLMKNVQLIDKLLEIENDVGFMEIMLPPTGIQNRLKTSYHLPEEVPTTGLYH